VESLFVPLFFVALPAALAALGAVLAWRAQRPVVRRRLALGFAWVLIGVPVAFFVMMLVGESIMDLGLARAAGMLIGWIAAAIAFVTLAWLRPGATVRLLAVLALAPIGLGVWSMLDPAGFGAWLDQVGPLNLVLTYLLIATATVVSLRRPRAAGVLILVMAGVPAVLPLLVAGEGIARELTIGALALPPMFAAVLMILAGTPGFVQHAPRPSVRPPDEGQRPSDRPPPRMERAL
jgi:hypothetical protein